jgi:ATP synthase protein I
VAKPEQDDGLSDTARAQHRAAPYLDAVWRMVGALLLGAGLGWFLDGRLGTGPWCLVGGLGLGLVAGSWSLYRSLLSMERR